VPRGWSTPGQGCPQGDCGWPVLEQRRRSKEVKRSRKNWDGLRVTHCKNRGSWDKGKGKCLVYVEPRAGRRKILRSLHSFFLQIT